MMRAVSVAIAFAITAGCSSTERAPQTHHVAIRAMQFVPAAIEVKVGDTVVWTNEDVVPHTVTAAGELDSQSIGTKQAWSYAARKTADFAYSCTFHPTMKGTLTVR